MFKTFRKKIVSLALSFIAIVIIGCTQSFAPVNNQIPFVDEKNGSGEYKVGGLVMNYEYETTGSTMKFTGVLNSRWKYNSVVVRLYFYDAKSALLKQEIVYFSTVRRSYRSGLIIERSLDVPADTAGIAFKVVGDQWYDND